MNDSLLYLREEHGDAFATQFPNGQTIPWRPLSVGDFLKYQDMYQMGTYAPAYIENEIFKKCVQDTILTKQINKLKAGIVTTVVAAIMAYSGPQSTQELDQYLNINRHKASGVLHEMVGFICQAFPAYKPEEVYNMDYMTLMLRTAQAERKMLSTGLINEPLTFEEAGHEQATPVAPVEQREEHKDLLDEYYKQQGIKVPESIKQKREMREQIIDHPKPPPLPADAVKQTIITKGDIMEHQTALSGHEKDIVSQIKATDETVGFYDGYMKDLKEGKELKILTPEERKVAAEARMQANKERNEARAKEALKNAKVERAELLKVREEARRRKAKKAARRRK